MASRSRRLLLLAARTDRTFREQQIRGARYLVGKCIHCRAPVSVPLSEGEPAHGTLEHIVPRTLGGGDELENIAVACARCNHGKGKRLDHRGPQDPTLRQVIARLKAERHARLIVDADAQPEESPQDPET